MLKEIPKTYQYEGKRKRVFCDCNSDWVKDRTTHITICGIAEPYCDTCGKYSWIKVRKLNKGESN